MIFVVAAVAVAPLTGRAAECPVAQPHPLTAAQIASMSGHQAEAESLYRVAIAKTPGDEELTAGLVGVLLAEQKIDDAAATIEAALKKAPQSPALLTALAEVEHRQGLPWEEAKTLNAAQVHGVCYAPLHRALADYFRFTSYYASALGQIRLAHQLDPYDPLIAREWRATLPREQRIASLKKYLAGANGDARGVPKAQAELATLESQERNESGCRLVSPITKPMDIPFTPIAAPSGALRTWGLEVAVNGRKSHLAIDTGASGIYINSSLAKKAKLQPLVRVQESGIGDKGPQAGYLAEADSIRIGKLEFRNCLVEVSDRRDITGIDGLIGTNVFSQFLVTLDFPSLKLTLAPLPAYPEANPGTSPGTSPGANSAAAAPEKLDTAGGAGSAENVEPHDRYIAPEMKDWMQVYRRGHSLIIPGLMNGKKLGLFVIDTGANASVIAPEAAAAVSKIHNNNGADILGVAGQVKKVYYASDFAVRFGNLEQKSARITVFDLSRPSESLGTEISGLLGEDTLSVLVVRIDYRDGLMKLEYSPHRGYQDYR
ncbi:MAG: aspartyl protease family protein [Acidobacteriaceae bacterium]